MSAFETHLIEILQAKSAQEPTPPHAANTCRQISTVTSADDFYVNSKTKSRRVPELSCLPASSCQTISSSWLVFSSFFKLGEGTSKMALG